ncbi:complex I intermediate-associated protein 30, mitochondrial-like [Saccostrea echinata]|uniref:complex I intermediate-associated protein 30, mitochondrial-like n=1 Tax=Saccostrea echinata TaxID=191078 RepID=UPI002A7F22DA|nr:complex I intermediate-associated protein 30, mitochondrial-like [Saccostrea echinata]
MFLRRSFCQLCKEDFVNLLSVVSAERTARRTISVDFQGRPQFRGKTEAERVKWLKDNIPRSLRKIDRSIEETLSCRNKLLVFHGEYDYFWKFDSEDKLNDWIVTTDSDNKQGFSRAYLALSRNKRALFYGNLCTEVPKDGEQTRAGYCQLRSPVSQTLRMNYDWSDFTHIVIRMRGDGRAYGLGLQTNYKRTGVVDFTMGLTANDQYHYPMFTRGGPYWQIVKIPFSKFYLSHKGTVQDKQSPMDVNEVGFFCINLMDNVDGPFHLEIDYIALLRDENHKEAHAYELYQVEDYVTNVY